jgi:hypothetical protein
MGGQHVKAALEAFERGNLEEATAIALHYYDKTYLHATSKGSFCQQFNLEAESTDCLAVARQLIKFSNEQQL